MKDGVCNECEKHCETCGHVQSGLFFTHRFYCGVKATGQMYEVNPTDCCEDWVSQKPKEDVTR